MEFRLATLSDLESIKITYIKIVENMIINGFKNWNNSYPVNYIEDDIVNNKFYIMIDGINILSGAAISNNHDGDNTIKWQNPKASAIYIDRLGVNVNYLHTGIASKMLQKIRELANSQNAEYIRLFVVDDNKPAVRLYEKNKFIKVDGIYNEVLDNEFILPQCGYEIRV